MIKEKYPNRGKEEKRFKMGLCSVPQCPGTGGFKFPRDPELRKKWQIAIRRQGPRKKLNWEPSETSTVCHAHFAKEDFKVPKTSVVQIGGRARKDLKDGAVPSVFPFKPRDETKVRRYSVSSLFYFVRKHCGFQSSIVLEGLHI